MEKKRIFMMGGILIGVLVLLLVAVWLLTNVKPTYYSFDIIEEKIAEATDRYYKKNPSALPENDGTYNLDYTTLSNSKVIKPLNKIIEGGDACSANIIIIKKGTTYTYIPYVNCGDKYTTKELYKQVLYDNKVTTTGSGLYQAANGEYYFRGKIENNYVAFGTTTKRKETTDNIWRIISIKDNIIKLKAEMPLKSKTSWDTRYNEKESGYYGYNDFDMSILKEYLQKLEKDNTILNEQEMTKLVPTNLCIGGRRIEDETKDGSAECSKLSKDELYFGTIVPYEFIRASLDENCKTLEDRSCSNFNYLSDISHDEEWTVTPDVLTNDQAYIFRGTSFRLEVTKSKNIIYPVISLNKYAFFKSGSGTKDDPYFIK